MEDLLASSYKVTTLQGGAIQEFLETSKFETYRKIWFRIQADNSLTRNTSEAVQLIRGGKDDYVFIYDGPSIRHIANKPPCDLITG